VILGGGSLALATTAALLPRRGFSSVAQSTPTGEPIKLREAGAPPENLPEAVAAYEQMVERFEAEHPNVTIESTPGGWDPQAFSARLAAGTLEDAFGVPYTEPQRLIARGQAADITDDLQAWEHFGSFNPGALQIATGQDGRLYGVPVFGYALGLLYNRTFFRDAGLDPDQPPATWPELREAAKALTDDGRAGFAETSKDNQGGWHFTAWTYSAGGELEQQVDGRWQAVFNGPTGVAVLQFLKDLRWTDQAMTERRLLNQNDIRQMLATDQVAMAIMAPDSLPWMKERFEDLDMTRFGLGILPQNGGNATLAGGAVWMVNPNASPEVARVAVDWILFKHFDLENLEARLAADRERGQLVGWPEQPLFVGEFQAERQAVYDAYANAPVENYRPFVEGSANLQLRPEPSVETQQMYAAIDPVVQAVLTDPEADPQAMLDQAAEQFQTQVLDRLG
jgi:ABC-type glycerol-3-phosphate transport system substrate-binding protein